jgi:hypothetical protein
LGWDGGCRLDVGGFEADGGREDCGGGLIRVSAALRPRWSRESWLSVLGSTVGREGCCGAGRVDG